jgi:hypothetical protein
MNIPDICDALYANWPSNFDEIQALGIPIREFGAGSGAFRKVYRVKGLPMVIKIPRAGADNIAHARAEFKTICRINRFKKYKPLRKYMPEILYFDYSTGIIGMRYYKPIRWTPMNQAASNILEDLVDSYWKNNWDGVTDIGSGNIGFSHDKETGNTQIVLIDLGCLLENE